MPSQPASDSYAAWRDRLAQANDPAFWPIEAIDAELIAGRAQFWCDGKAALVTHVVEYPGGARVVEALAAAGDGRALVGPIADGVAEQAKDAGCSHLKVAGRKGWLRRLTDGWALHQVIIVKELTDGDT